MKIKKIMFSQSVKTCKIIAKTMFFEGLQVEGVNGERCQENIKNDARNHAKINGKTLLDLCSTSDAKIIGKMSKNRSRKGANK